MKTFYFLDSDHKWTHVGRKAIKPKLRVLPHKHLYQPTMLESFVDYVDFDIYQDIRKDFLNGRFCYLMNNDEYAYMLLFDLMNGYPENALETDFIKLNDELQVLCRLSKVVAEFFEEYINNREYKEYLRADKKGVSKIFVNSDPNTIRFLKHEKVEYAPIIKDILPRDHSWEMVDENVPLDIKKEIQPLFYCQDNSIHPDMSLDSIISRMDNLDWKRYMRIRQKFLAGEFPDLTYKPLVALHLMYDFMGGQEIDEKTDQEKLHNELWVLGQCSDIVKQRCSFVLS